MSLIETQNLPKSIQNRLDKNPERVEGVVSQINDIYRTGRFSEARLRQTELAKALGIKSPEEETNFFRDLAPFLQAWSIGIGTSEETDVQSPEGKASVTEQEIREQSKYFFDGLDDSGHRNEQIATRLEGRLGEVLRAFSKAPKNVLDLGGSDGAVGRFLIDHYKNGVHVSVVDKDSKAIQDGREIEQRRWKSGKSSVEKGKIDFFEKDIDVFVEEKIEEIAAGKAEKPDTIILSTVLMHKVNAKEFLKKVMTCVAPGGRVILSDVIVKYNPTNGESTNIDKLVNLGYRMLTPDMGIVDIEDRMDEMLQELGYSDFKYVEESYTINNDFTKHSILKAILLYGSTLMNKLGPASKAMGEKLFAERFGFTFNWYLDLYSKSMIDARGAKLRKDKNYSAEKTPALRFGTRVIEIPEGETQQAAA